MRATRANTAPVPVPSAAAIPRNAIVATGISGSWNAATDGEDRDHGEGGDEDGDRAQPVAEPAADGAHGDGEHDETGGAQGGVAAVEVVGGGQVGGQVHAERDEAAERDGVEE